MRTTLLVGIMMTVLGLGSLEMTIKPSVAQVQPHLNSEANREADRYLVQAFDLFKANKFEAAIETIQKAIPLYHSVQNFEAESLALGLLANSSRNIGKYDVAIEALQKSLMITRQMKNQALESGLLNEMGAVYQFTGRYDKASEYYQQGLTIARTIKDRGGESESLNRFGLLYLLLGNESKAIGHLEQSLTIAQELNLRAEVAATLNNLANAYRVSGDYAKALVLHQQSLTINRELKNRLGEQISLSNLGNVAFGMKKYDEAIKYQEQSLEIAQALKVPYGQQQALLNMAAAYDALGNFSKAAELSQQALSIARQSNDRSAQSMALANIGDFFLRDGKLSEAEKNLKEAITISESLRLGLNDANKVSFAETQKRLYELYQDILVKQNKTDLALEIAERGRGRAFAELLASRLTNASPAEIQSIAKSPKLDEIRLIAKAQKATIVEYTISTNSLYIWVIQPNGSITFKSVDLKKLPVKIGELVQEARNSIAVRSRRRNASESSSQSQNETNEFQQLQKLLIEPISSELPTDPNQRVIFIPQGELFLVPFVALQDNQGKYLIEQHTISSAPSIQTLALTREKAKSTQSGKSSVIVGNPTMPMWDGTQLTTLKGAEREAISIAKLFNVQAITGNQATKSAVLNQMQNASIVHLATHGLLDNVKGDIPGAIALAPSGNDTGFLTSNEIFDLKLNANMVVLSACDTGRGKITGDGVVGLSRSFVAAGVPSVLVSLWAVNDDSTSVLMSQFYRNLQTNPNKAIALRQAMLSTMQQHPNPIDWAAFTLIGEV